MVKHWITDRPVRVFEHCLASVHYGSAFEIKI